MTVMTGSKAGNKYVVDFHHMEKKPTIGKISDRKSVV